MEKKRQPGENEEIHGGTFQGGPQGQTGEQPGPKRIRSLSEELPGTEPMLSDPGEPHKGIEQHSSRHTPAEPQQEPHELLGEDDIAQIRPVLGEDNVSQKHPLLGEETVSMQNEREERERRRMEAERTAEDAAQKKKKPAA